MIYDVSRLVSSVSVAHHTRAHVGVYTCPLRSGGDGLCGSLPHHRGGTDAPRPARFVFRRREFCYIRCAGIDVYRLRTWRPSPATRHDDWSNGRERSNSMSKVEGRRPNDHTDIRIFRPNVSQTRYTSEDCGALRGAGAGAKAVIAAF